MKKILLLVMIGILLLVMSVSQKPVAAAAVGWHTSGSTLLDPNGNVFHMSGVNWFGAETPDCAPDGLWSMNYKEQIDQMKALGYNTIRLPYSTDFMDDPLGVKVCTPNISTYANPDLAGLHGVGLLDVLINYAGSDGLHVFLDRHRAENSTQSALWYDPGSSKYTEARWISDWQWLANHYLNNPTVIGADLHNEPHSIQGQPNISACWGCGNTATDWKLAAERAGNAILSVNPNWLIIVEGTDTNPLTGATTWWGGDLSNAGNDPVVLNTPNKVVYSPHEYPASLFAQTWFSDPTYPANLPSVWESHWGYLETNNIAPVLIGEFGSKLATTSDIQWFDALTIGPPNNGYIKSKSLNWTFWSWNPNSGDTGGILQDDWTTVIQAKQSVLAQIQYPFYGTSSGGTPVPSNTPGGPTATPTNTFTPVPTAVPGLAVQINKGAGTDSNSETTFNFLVKNTGSGAFSAISTRIYFTTDGSNAASGYTLEKYYDQSGVATISGPTLACGNTYYFTVSYGTTTLMVGGQWEFQTALHLASWASTYDGSNDWYHTGYAVGALPATYTNTNYIPGYVNGALDWGVEPCTGGTPVPTNTATITAASSTPTATVMASKTNTPTFIPPSATATTGSSATPTPTVVATKTSTPTFVPPSATSTPTSGSSATATTVPPTKTNTPVGPTATKTNTPAATATSGGSDPCASPTVITGGGSFNVTTSTTCFKYVNTTFVNGGMFSVMKDATATTDTLKWYGGMDQNATSCTNQSATISGNGGQLNNFTIAKDSNGQMFLIITGTGANSVTISIQNWQNGTGCSVKPTVHP